MIRNKPVFVLGLMLAAGLAIGWFLHDKVFLSAKSYVAPAPVSQTVQVRADLPYYNFINPLLYSDNARDYSSGFVALTSLMNDYIVTADKDPNVDDVSVYFRDLNSARWTGVSEDIKYKPSSMLKVLVMMAVVKAANTDPSFLSKQINYRASDHADQYYKPDSSIKSGSYTVQYLVSDMITESDNDALDALYTDPLIQSHFNSLYSLFRLPASATTTIDFMSAKSYSAVFRVLFNSTAFSWDLSEQMLNLLSKTSFNSGLVEGVPIGTLVSHKFGENTAVLPDGTLGQRELHDCGIVYYPDHPYLLCVMTKGTDFTTLEKTISGMSKLVYNFVESGAIIKK